MIRLRKECRELSWGECKVLSVDAPEVLALTYAWRGTQMVTVHNFSAHTTSVKLSVRNEFGADLIDLFAERHSRSSDGQHALELEGYGYRWFRVGVIDNALYWRDLA